MVSAKILITLTAFAALVSCRPNTLSKRSFTGVATFNDYASQSSTVCGPKSANSSSLFGAAAGDLSADISGGKCSGSIDMSICSGSSAPSDYSGPSCPTTNCGTCYKVTNTGGYGGASVGGVGTGTVTVQIIDACPAESADNFCKANADVPADERCAGPGNSLDIDQSAYAQLTGGTSYASGLPNLEISIEPTSC